MLFQIWICTVYYIFPVTVKKFRVEGPMSRQKFCKAGRKAQFQTTPANSASKILWPELELFLEQAHDKALGLKSSGTLTSCADIFCILGCWAVWDTADPSADFPPSLSAEVLVEIATGLQNLAGASRWVGAKICTSTVAAVVAFCACVAPAGLAGVSAVCMGL